MSDSPGRKPLLRFSIAALLFLMLCVGGYLGGYRAGYDSGQRQRFRDEIAVVSYDIEFMHGPDYSAAAIKKKADDLTKLITTTIGSNRWADPWVVNSIELSPDFTKLEVTNYGPVH